MAESTMVAAQTGALGHRSAGLLDHAKDGAKWALTCAGRWTGPRTVKRLDFVGSYLYVGGWMFREGYWPRRRCRDRFALFESLFKRLGDGPVLYLEFGVYEGDSLRFWSRNLTHPDSRLFGFDSFEGLPESWHEDSPRGRFDRGGAVPRIDDSRVQFVKGWFDYSLSVFEMPEHERLVVSLDADLYSSTKCVLDWLTPQLRPGDILYFDEFFDRHHELRALDEFLASSRITLKLVGATRSLTEVAFEVAGV